MYCTHNLSMNTKNFPYFQCIIHASRHEAYCILLLDGNLKKNPQITVALDREALGEYDVNSGGIIVRGMVWDSTPHIPIPDTELS